MTPKKETLDEIKQNITTEKIDPLSKKVDKCYSKERYEEFQDAVEKIINRYLKFVLAGAALFWLLSIIASMLLQKYAGVI